MSSLVNRWRVPAIGVLLLILILSISISLGLAQAVKPVPAAVQPENVPRGWGDEGIKEVGVEWINDFPGTGDDRSHWDESCDGLYNSLTGSGWTGNFHWTDWNAWKSDFVRAASGGEENTYADSVDIAMLCTHGSGNWDPFWSQNLSSVYFGSSHPDQDLMPGDAYMSYGDKDLEWLAFDSCSVLSDGGPAPFYNRGYWSTTMNGLHLLLGFKNTMYVWAPGDGAYWGFLMKGLGWFLPPSTVTQAWFKAVDYNQPHVTCARVLAETPDNYNDYLHGYGYVSPDPVSDGTYWYWDHCSTNPAAADKLFENQPDSPLLAVPVFQVQQRTVNEDYTRQVISPAFFAGGYTGEIGEDENFYFMVDNSHGVTLTVQVAKNSGGFNFQNLSKLWTTPAFTYTLPDAETAFSLAQNYFSQTPAEGLPGVWYRAGWEYMLEGLVEAVRQGPEGDQAENTTQLGYIPADVDLTFGRMISAPARTANGVQMEDFTILGPGSLLRVYLGDGGEIIGVQGGTRDVIINGEVEILDPDQAWEMFLKNPNIAIPEVPYPADTITYSGVIFGYYELPLTQFQQELIPVYLFLANFYQNGTPVAENVFVYLPAAMKYMPPTVSITLPADGDRFNPGEWIAFSGMAEGGMPPYTFEWKSDHDGYLGSGPDITSSLSSSTKSGKLFSHIISVHVTDANGMQATASIEVYINALNRLPILINRR